MLVNLNKFPVKLAACASKGLLYPAPKYFKTQLTQSNKPALGGLCD